MRAAEAGHDVEAMMQRAGAAVAKELMRRFPDARRVAIHAGGGANGGDGRIAGEILRAQGRELVDERPDVVIDALLGTGLRGAPREETLAADRADQRRRRSGARSRHPVRRERVHRRGRRRGGSTRTSPSTMHGPKVGLAVAPGRFHAGEVAVADIGLETAETEHRLVTAGDPRRGAAPFARATTSTRRVTSSSSVVRVA